LFDKPVIVQKYVCYVSASIGIVYYPSDGHNFEELLKNADTAMYHAKQIGKRKYVIFNQEMNDTVVEKAKIQNNLQQAIEQEEFILYYQPQVELSSGRIIGLEALIRWQSKDMNLIVPDKFIGIAEETGQIVLIGYWVLKTACFFMKKMHDLGYGRLSVSVNISSLQLRQEDFVAKVREILKETGFDPGKLVLEITETVLIDFLDPHILTTLHLLQGQGIGISLDDFGQGYSSLNYLTKMPIDTLKLLSSWTT
jgi:predicted signal transduction protein with EAL and GGDEF domain